jgi:TolA-binding protein
MGETKRALNQFEDYILRFPEDELAGDVRFWLGEYYANRKDFDRAEKYFNDLIRIYPEGNLAADAAYRIAIITYERGELNRAMKALEGFKINYPESELIPAVEQKIVDMLIKKDDLGQAKERLLKLTIEYKNTAFVKTAYKYLGDIAKREGDIKDAINYYKKSLDDRRGDFNAGIQFTIGRLYEESGDIESAVAEYMKVGYIYPDSTDIVANATLYCARILEKQDKIDEAVKLYKKVSEMDAKEAADAKEKLKAIETNK